MTIPLPIRSYEDELFRNGSTPERLSAYQIRGLARELSNTAFDNLDEFQYLYFTAGATEAIDSLLIGGPVEVHPRDYRYVFMHPTSSVRKADKAYRSFPFSGDGRFGAIPSNEHVILDCAYIFASNMSHNRVLPSNVKQVIFSLSKSHNLADHRAGWFFSKQKIRHMDVLQYDYGYVSAVTGELIDRALHFSPNELYLRNKNALSNKFQAAGLAEPDTNLFGLDSSGNRVPYYML